MTQGKILGGSSVLNSMSFVRGNRKDYDTWQDGYGAHGWSYEDVLPVFKEIETYYIRNPGRECNIISLLFQKEKKKNTRRALTKQGLVSVGIVH